MYNYTFLLLFITPWMTGVYSVPSIGLYFQLNNQVYLPGQTINISDIGKQPGERSDPGSTLVCVTANVNRVCCRGKDGGRVGEWYYPNGTVIPRFPWPYNKFYRTAFIHQLHLCRFPGTIGPTGMYWCRVPDSTGELVGAGIIITSDIIDHPDYANISLTISEDTVTNHGLVYFNCSVGFELFGNYLLLYTPSNEVVSSQMPGFTVSSGSRWTSVTISPVQLAHAGEYTCVVTGRSVTERATKSLYVKLHTPVSIFLVEPYQHIFATTSHTIPFHIQLQSPVDIPFHFNIHWTPPMGSTQDFEILQVNATGRASFDGSISLISLDVVDSGQYACYVSLSSTAPYVVESSFTNKTTTLNVRAVPEIRVKITEDTRLLGHNDALICSHESSDPFFTYYPTFVWRHNGVIMDARTFTILLYYFVSLKDVGNYTCEVIANSNPIGRPINGTSGPHSIFLPAPSPESVQLQVPASPIFAGTSPWLTCTATFPNSGDINLTVTMEIKGSTYLSREQAIKKLSGEYISVFSIPNVTVYHAREYNCTVVASGSFILEGPSSTSKFIELAIVGPPSPPTILTTSAYSTSVNFTWSVSLTVIVDHFLICYQYTIRGCSSSKSSNIPIWENSTRSYNLNGLEENSDVIITLSAVNGAGRNSTTFNTTTLPSAPAIGPASLRVTSTSSTSITTAWEPVPCVDRNTDITGYRVTYSGVLARNMHEITTNNLEYEATGLIPRENYTFCIFPIYDAVLGESVKSSILGTTAVIKDLGFFLNGSLYSNNSLVEARDIGINDFGLFCLTNLRDCCRYPFSFNKGFWKFQNRSFSFTKGFWRFPNRSAVYPYSYQYQYSAYRSRYASSIILHFKSHLPADNGVYTCTTPDSMNISQNLYIHIADYFPDLGIDALEYNRSSSILTCISKGRPVDSIQWLKDGHIIGKDNPQYNESQEIINAAIASYQHNLSSDTKENFEGRYTCEVKDVYGNLDSRTIMINNCPAGQYGAVAFDGSTVCIACPANSMSTSEGSNECGCLLGYYRNSLEDHNFPCTRPPSKCQNLRRVQKGSVFGSANLIWNRPLITGRNDLYYNVYLSNPDLPGKFIQENFYPVISNLGTIEYSLSKLRPLTEYTAKVSVHNGVSEMDQFESNKRMCEVMWTTADEDIGPPRSVLALCSVVAWQIPAKIDEKIITGYDITLFSTSTNNTVLVIKNSDELFHVIKKEDWPEKHQNSHTSIMVRAKTSTSNGTWSESIPLSC